MAPKVSFIILISQMDTLTLEVGGPGLYQLSEPSWNPPCQTAFDLKSNQIKMMSEE